MSFSPFRKAARSSPYVKLMKKSRTKPRELTFAWKILQIERWLRETMGNRIVFCTLLTVGLFIPSEIVNTRNTGVSFYTLIKKARQRKQKDKTNNST